MGTSRWTRWLYCVECPQYSIRLEELDYLCTRCLRGDVVQPSWPSPPLKIWNVENPRWLRPPSWKIAIFQPWLDRFWRNLARLSISKLLTVPTVKNLKFQNPRWRRPPSLKNRKISISRLRLERFQRNLAQWCSLTLLSVPTVKNLKILKSTMASAAILKSWKIAILQGFELIAINCNKSNSLTTRRPSHKLPHQCVTYSF